MKRPFEETYELYSLLARLKELRKFMGEEKE
jgi:hypothetical protein